MDTPSDWSAEQEAKDVASFANHRGDWLYCSFSGLQTKTALQLTFGPLLGRRSSAVGPIVGGGLLASCYDRRGGLSGLGPG